MNTLFVNDLSKRIRKATSQAVKFTKDDSLNAYWNYDGSVWLFENYGGIYISPKDTYFRVVRVDKENALGEDFYNQLPKEYVEVINKKYKLWWPVRAYNKLVSYDVISFLKIKNTNRELEFPYKGIEVFDKFVGNHFIADESFYSLSILKLPDELKEVPEFKKQMTETEEIEAEAREQATSTTSGNETKEIEAKAREQTTSTTSAREQATSTTSGPNITTTLLLMALGVVMIVVILKYTQKKKLISKSQK